MIKVGVVGASGYVGGETLRLLVNHPEVEITMVTSRQHVGEYLHRVQPSLKGFTDLTFSELDYDKISDNCDLVFTAVPHGTATEIVKALYDRGIKIIDLSADYRLHNPEDYGKWYGWVYEQAPGIFYRYAASLRFRAVMMTALSFILGVLPLVLATGAGAAARVSVGLTVFGGMLLATILGVVFVPFLYVQFQRLREAAKREKKPKPVGRPKAQRS